MGFFSFETAWQTLQGFEIMNMKRKGQLKGVKKGDGLGQVALVNKLFGMAAEERLSGTLALNFFPYMLISNQAHSTEGRSKRYTCSRELLNTLEKGSSFHPARPMKKARASPAMFLRATDDEKVVLRAPQYKGTVTQERC